MSPGIRGPNHDLAEPAALAGRRLILRPGLVILRSCCVAGLIPATGGAGGRTVKLTEV